MFFRNREFMIFGSLEPAKLHIREYVKFGDRDSEKTWSHERAEARNLEPAVARTSKGGWFGNLSGTQFGSHAWRYSRTGEEAKADSGICRGPGSGVTYEDIHEPTKKQCQSCRPKKSRFWVWTSGRLVNMLDEKDVLICVHTRNILWSWGCFRNVKVPSSPYKRGREGTCKRIQIFGNLCNLLGESPSLSALTLCLIVTRTLSLVLGKSSEFFR
jgi:hypothetical protein